MPKTRNLQMHQCYDVILFSFKSEKSQYKKVQRNKKDGKGKRDGEGHWGDEINPMVIENSSSETTVYHHIIYKY